MSKLHEAIKSLLQDIDEMRASEVTFGPFSEGHQKFTMDGSVTWVEWPNLTISAAAVQQALEEETHDPSSLSLHTPTR